MIGWRARAGAAVRLAALALALIGALGGSAAAAPPRYGIIVAERDYRAPLPEVAWADKDAALMREVFQKVLNIPADHIDYHPDSPTMNQLQRLFGGDRPGSMGSDITEPDAELFVYFVGHGSKEKLEGVGTTLGYLLAPDSSATDLLSSAYPYDRLLDNLQALQETKFPKGHVYLFMESCFSGRTQAGELLASNTMASLGQIAFEERPGITIVSAAGSEQYSYWDDELKHGIFTFYLAAGLWGRADGAGGAEKDSSVTVAELGRYLREKVSDRARLLRKDADQTPEIAGGGSGDVLASRAGAPPVIPDLDRRAFVERALLQALLRVDIATVPPAKLTETRQRLNTFWSGCSSCDDDPQLATERRTYLAALSSREVACQGERELYRTFAANQLFDQLKDTVDRCDPASGCCEAQVGFTAGRCAASKSGDSEACRCLDSDTCLNEAVADPECAPKLEAARAAALAGASLAPLASYQRDFAHCPQAAGVADLKTELCRTVSDQAGDDPAKLRAFVAGMGDCPQIADARDRLRKAECAADWSRVVAAPEDDAILASFLKERQDCSETEDATRALERRVAAAWDAAQTAEQGRDYRGAMARLDGVLEAFGSHIGDQQRSRLEERIARLRELAAGTECETAFNQARRSGLGADLERFVADNPACDQQIGKARALIERCVGEWERVRASGRSADMRSFAISRAAECPQQAAEAASAAEQAEQAERDEARGRCAAAWRSVRYSSDAGQLQSFLDANAGCPETTQADQRLDELFSSCTSAAEREASASAERGVTAFQRCRSDFGRDPDRARQVDRRISELQAQAQAQAVRVREFVTYDHVDLSGDDIADKSRIPASSVSACEDQCRSDSRCRAFTFNTLKRVCILKYGLGEPITHPDAVSGVYADGPRIDIGSVSFDERPRTDFSCDGCDYLDRRYVSLGECRSMCSNDSRCAAFSYVAKKQWCWLKSWVPSPRRATGVVSGVKR